MNISYNWLKAYLPGMPEAEKLADIFNYHVCEVESVKKLENGDYIFDLGILPNRAHDLLSHIGVARELSGLLGIAFKDPTPMYKTPPSKPTDLKVEIDSQNCRRYMARIVRGVKVGPSPEWMVTHLESIGQRSINNIVDATNIVMFDCGQPAHAFDLKKITNYELRITNAKEGEKFKTVGRESLEVTLKDTDIVISNGEKTLALAGVKGGLDSGINDTTTEIVLEIANFDPILVRKTARRLGLLSDSAKRFENDLSPTLCDFGMFSLSALLLELFPDASFEEIVDIHPEQQKKVEIEFSTDFINKKLGSDITDKDIENILMRYQFQFTTSIDKFSGPRGKSPDAENLSTDSVNFLVTIPPLRLDLLVREDMVEEIGRVYGYDKVKPERCKVNFTTEDNPVYGEILKARESLVEAGYREVMTYTFTESGEVEVLASASDKKFLRTNLTDGLKKSYELNKLNTPLLGLDEIKIFEIGTVFTKFGEAMNVVWNEGEKIIETSLGEFSERFNSSSKLDSRSTNFSDLATSYLLPITFSMWSQYPFVVRDIAVWVPEGTKPETLSEIYKNFGTELLQGEPKLIDKFTKNGKISYAFRLIFQSYDRTLTDDEVNQIMANITQKITTLGFTAR